MRDVGSGPGALLGPEGSDRRSRTRRQDGFAGAERLSADRIRFEPPALQVRRRQRIRDCPYLENCTVDASIFVAKLVRAHGGCLGTRSR